MQEEPLSVDHAAQPAAAHVSKSDVLLFAVSTTSILIAIGLFAAGASPAIKAIGFCLISAVVALFVWLFRRLWMISRSLEDKASVAKQNEVEREFEEDASFVKEYSLLQAYASGNAPS